MKSRGRLDPEDKPLSKAWPYDDETERLTEKPLAPAATVLRQIPENDSSSGTFCVSRILHTAGPVAAKKAAMPKYRMQTITSGQAKPSVSKIARINAGRSAGWREVMRLPSTTTSRSR